MDLMFLINPVNKPSPKALWKFYKCKAGRILFEHMDKRYLFAV